MDRKQTIQAIMADLDRSYEAIQTLQGMPLTEGNVNVVLLIMNSLKNGYFFLKDELNNLPPEEEKKEEEIKAEEPEKKELVDND